MSSSESDGSPFDCDYEKAAIALRNAMEGLGTDEKAIIKVTAKTSEYDRQEICDAYKKSFGRDLIEDFKKETSGDFESLLLALYTDKIVYVTKCLHKAMKGAGTDETVLIELMTGMSTDLFAKVNIVYESMYGKTLESDLKDDLSGDFKRFMVALCNSERDDSDYDSDMARTDALELYEAGELKFGTDESTFIRILCTRSNEQLQKTFKYYKEVSGKTILESIENEFSGDIEKALKAFCTQVIDGSDYYFAKRLFKAIDGLGTDEKTIIRIVATQSGGNLQDIIEIYPLATGCEKGLIDHVKGDTSGDFRRLLKAILKQKTSY